MIIENEDYIVKARDLDLEIKNKHKYIKHLIVFELLIVIIALLQFIFLNNSSLLIFLMPFIIYPVVTILEYNWSLKIINRTIYIKNHSGHHEIKYKDLVSVKASYRGRNNIEKVLTIKYLKKKKMISVILPFGDNLDFQIEKICNSFITNKELESVKQIGYGYFYVRDDGEESVFKDKKKLNRTFFLITLLIFSSIVVIFMLIKLLKMMK